MPDASTQTTRGKKIKLNKPKKEEEKNTCYKCDVEVTQDNFYRDEFNNKSYNCCNDCGIEEEEDDDDEEEEEPRLIVMRVRKEQQETN